VSRRDRTRRGPQAGSSSRCRRGPRRADPAPGQPPDELLERDLDGEGPVDPTAARRERLVEGDRLGPVAREAVEHDAADGIRCREPIEEHLDRDVVGHELAAFHVAPRLEADRRAVAHGRAEEVTGRHMRKAESLGQDRCLCALPGARRAEEDEDGHRMKPS
jgi:hypothetical protein